MPASMCRAVSSKVKPFRLSRCAVLLFVQVGVAAEEHGLLHACNVYAALLCFTHVEELTYLGARLVWRFVQPVGMHGAAAQCLRFQCDLNGFRLHPTKSDDLLLLGHGDVLAQEQWWGLCLADTAILIEVLALLVGRARIRQCLAQEVVHDALELSCPHKDSRLA